MKGVLELHILYRLMALAGHYTDVVIPVPEQLLGALVFQMGNVDHLIFGFSAIANCVQMA